MIDEAAVVASTVAFLKAEIPKQIFRYLIKSVLETKADLQTILRNSIKEAISDFQSEFKDVEVFTDDQFISVLSEIASEVTGSNDGESEAIVDMQLKTQLRALISQKGVSVTTLAKSTRIPVQTLHSWMSGAKPRDFDQVKKVADYFGVSLDFIAYGKPSIAEAKSAIEKHQDEINAGVFEVILRRTRSIK